MKIYKKILPAMALGAMLVSCSKSPMPQSMRETGEILFGSRGISVKTKSLTETTVDVLQAEGFRCAGVVDTDKSVMFNECFTYVDGVYKVPEKKYFFPENGSTMSFFAVFPSSETVQISADGKATVDYQQNDSEDVVVASACNVDRTDDSVNLDFSHILSQLVIKCKGNDAATDFHLKGVYVTAPSSGTFDYSSGTWTKASAQEFSFFTDEENMISSSEFEEKGGLTFIPSEVQVRFVWECRIKGTQTVVGDYDQSISTELVKGRRSTMNVTLSNSDADELKFTATVDDWEGEETDYDMESLASLGKLQKKAIDEINAAMGSYSSAPAVIAEAQEAIGKIRSATTAKEIERQKRLGIQDVKYAISPGIIYDLSKIDFITEEALPQSTSANCYVVRHRGMFTLPCYYGNSLTKGSDNASSYTGTPFMDHEGKPITKGRICDHLKLSHEAFKADLLWETSSGLISDVTYQQGLIKFTVTDKQAAGNALIALRKIDGNEVVWSWHIWLPGREAEFSFFEYRDEKLLNLDLGAQSENQENPMYYQWGRKDPFPATVKRKMDDGMKPGNLSIKDAIANPDAYFMVYDGPWQNWFNDEYLDTEKEYCMTMWNAANTAIGGDTDVVKTIYDPCPAGFCVPRKKCFTGFEYKLTADGNTVKTCNDDNGNPGTFRAGIYLGSRGEPKDHAQSYYWMNSPCENGGYHAGGHMMKVEKGVRADMRQLSGGCGCIVRPMKMK